jgi:hypothetical protein
LLDRPTSSTKKGVSPFGRSIRRWVRVVLAWTTLAVIAAPAAFGPAIGGVMHALGVSMTEHVCKCGMPAGKCGCPECDRLEQERLHEHQGERLAALKRHCDDDAPPIPFGALPSAVLAARGATTLPVPRGERLPVAAPGAFFQSAVDEPPTPPPRSASV